MRKVRVEVAAAQELEEAAAWYEAESPGTGSRRLEAFESAVSLLSEDPGPLVNVPREAGRLGAKHAFIASPLTLLSSRKTTTW